MSSSSRLSSFAAVPPRVAEHASPAQTDSSMSATLEGPGSATAAGCARAHRHSPSSSGSPTAAAPAASDITRPPMSAALHSCSEACLLLPETCEQDVFAGLDACLERLFEQELSVPVTTGHCSSPGAAWATSADPAEQWWQQAGQQQQQPQAQPRQCQHWQPDASMMPGSVSPHMPNATNSSSSSSWHACPPMPWPQQQQHHHHENAAVTGAHKRGWQAELSGPPATTILHCAGCFSSGALPLLPKRQQLLPPPAPAAAGQQGSKAAVHLPGTMPATHNAACPTAQASQLREQQLQHLRQQHQQLQVMLARTQQLQASLHHSSPEEAAALAQMVLGG